MWIKRIVRLLLLGALLIALSPSQAKATAVNQTDDLNQQAEAILQAMSSQERVGQLFLVTFQGDSASQSSDIASLILDYHIGGVVLEAENDNITGYGDLDNVPQQLLELNNNLQRLSLLGISLADVIEDDPSLEEDAVPPTRIPEIGPSDMPLLIVVAQEGDGYPYSQIFHGLTAVPSNMAIGATWEPELARNVGTIVGRELNALGINMLFGPSLDVLENPVPYSSSDLGTRTFGGDPYWVGLMGRAYTEGVHLGSNQRMAVVPKHFPGQGSSDRPLHVEVPTVRKSLEQLSQIELAPFFAVTADSSDHLQTADALLTAHIRYQGFQGNIRATTNPVSFDQQALSTLMAQANLAAWRTNDGILVSDQLGVRAVERFYDDTGQEFPHRLVAKDAFLAGNDLLYLGDFALNTGNYEQELENIKDTATWFQERYETDAAFQQQVDTAVLRIIKLKLRLYDSDFSLSNVLVDADEAFSIINQGQATMFNVAQNALTLISPTLPELPDRLPQPPTLNDNIVIFTDTRFAQQCSSCPLEPYISENAIAEAMLTLYGPQASGQIRPDQISSFSLDDLSLFLAESEPIIFPSATVTPTQVPLDITPTIDGDETPVPSPTPAPPPAFLVQEALRDADWIVFGLLDADEQAQTLSQFLAQRPDIARNSQVIVFAYNVPYLLDTTEISQLAAYFGVYSKTRPFIDASVRALFQELPPIGNSPVNIGGVRYELFTQTQPDPTQQIELYILDSDGERLQLGATPVDVSVGDTLKLQTGVIVDRNDNPVPDGTLVRFIQRDLVQGLINIIDEVPTTNGIAQLDYLLEARTEAGIFQIRAESGPANISFEVNISVEANEGQLSVSTPVPPTETPMPTATATETVVPTVTEVVVEPEVTPEAPVTLPPEEPNIRITLEEVQLLMTMVLGLGGVVGLGLFLTPREFNPSQIIGRLLWGVVGALVVYNYFALGLPGTAVLLTLGSWAGLLTSLVGGALGLLLYNMRYQPGK